VVAEWGKGDVTVGKVEVSTAAIGHAAGLMVGRSQWNMTGSILSVASEDGKVRLFKG
jgi:hypothetical protein